MYLLCTLFNEWSSCYSGTVNGKVFFHQPHSDGDSYNDKHGDVTFLNVQKKV